MDKEIKELQVNILAFCKSKITVSEACAKLGVKEYELLGLIELLKQQGSLSCVQGGVLGMLPKPERDKDIFRLQHTADKVKLLCISDTHLCSKYDRLDILRYLYQEAEDKGVSYVLHSGDFTDGRSNRPEQVYELREASYQGQVDYCIDKYPTFSGRTVAISGNHDDWWYKSAGSDILVPVSRAREDITYLGPDIGDITIGKLRIRLYHGYGSVAYAKSYKIQKYLDTVPLGERPDILQTGHIHQSFFYKQDHTYCLQTSCLEDQTPYCRSLGLANDKSCWWVTVQFDDKGNVARVTPELETFDKVKRIRR